jgi:hypothetical protein
MTPILVLVIVIVILIGRFPSPRRMFLSTMSTSTTRVFSLCVYIARHLVWREDDDMDVLVVPVSVMLSFGLGGGRGRRLV